MRPITTLLVACAAFGAAADAAAQTSAQLRKELKTREKQIDKDDADGLVELAQWCREQGLLRDYTRLLKKAKDADPDHEGANTGLGFVKVDGEWVTREKAEIMRQRAMDAAMKEKGFVKVDGVWVSDEQVADARKGVFWHEGARVSKQDKLEFAAGRIRHPRTGEFIDPADAERAAGDQFPTQDGQWLDLESANRYHANRERPWVVRSEWAVLVGTMPLGDLEAHKAGADGAVESALPVVKDHPPPSHRPVIWVCANTEEYKEIGSAIGGGGSAYGAFLALPDRQLDVPGLGPRRVAVCNDLPNWGPYYVKHAAALAAAAGVCDAQGIEAPDWFLRGVGSLAERFKVPGDTAHFGRQHVQKGGVKNVKTFISAFAINGEMQSRDIDYNIFQAGLLLDFAMRGGDDQALEAMQAVTEAIAESPKSAKRAFGKLEQVLGSKSDEIQAYLQTLTR